MIVDNARESADKARRLASEVGEFRTRKLVERAERAANLAESMLAARNRAYTFFTTPGFSFGEGWYLAAASCSTNFLSRCEPARLKKDKRCNF